MNEYKYSDIRIGQTESFSVIITQRMVDCFRETTGDINPMHTDADYAKTKGFPDKIVYGMLTASFFSTLAGVYLPGKYCLFQELENIKFRKPVFVNDNLTIRGTVTEKNDMYKRFVIKSVIYSNNNDIVCSGKLVVGVTE
jgi:3-hydroxybutyryl-CoA dehydratase